VKEILPQTLEADGILFEINRRILHPLGMEIRVDPVYPDRLEVISATGPCGITFTSSAFHEGESKFETFMERIGYGKHAARRVFLRFVEQESADQGSDSVRPPPR